MIILNIQFKIATTQKIRLNIWKDFDRKPYWVKLKQIGFENGKFYILITRNFLGKNNKIENESKNKFR